MARNFVFRFRNSSARPSKAFSPSASRMTGNSVRAHYLANALLGFTSCAQSRTDGQNTFVLLYFFPTLGLRILQARQFQRAWTAAASSCIPLALRPRSAKPPTASPQLRVRLRRAEPCGRPESPRRFFRAIPQRRAHGQKCLCSNPPRAPAAALQIPAPRPSATSLFPSSSTSSCRRTYLSYLQRAAGSSIAADQLSNFRRGKRHCSARLQDRSFSRLPVRRQSRRHIHGNNKLGRANVALRESSFTSEITLPSRPVTGPRSPVPSSASTITSQPAMSGRCSLQSSRRSLPAQYRRRCASAGGSRRHRR